jgi:hypothetical protein
MPLLNQMPQEYQSPEQEQITEEQNEGNEQGENEAGEFTINADQIQSGIKDQLDEKQNKALIRILDAGNKLLFGKDTHYDVMEGLTDDDDTQLADELGKGGIAIANLLFQKSGGTMPQELIIPAGVILMARVAEFLNQTGHKINDDIFHNAVVMFDSGLKQSVDPKYKDMVDQALNDSGSQDQEQAPQEVMPQPQASGLLGGQ